MPRLATSIHVLEKSAEDEILRRVDGTVDEWETGYWIIGDSTAKALIGGMVYVHRGQYKPSHAGGKIVDIYHATGTDLKRRVIRFKDLPTAKNVLTEKQGWGNERKVIWRNEISFQAQIADEDDESAFPEGGDKFELHHGRERDSAITRKAKRLRLAKTGKLECEVCDFDFSSAFGPHGEGFIEAHHRVPVSELDGTKRTKIRDLALVCSNCHRMLHRGRPLPTVEDLRILRQSGRGH